VADQLVHKDFVHSEYYIGSRAELQKLGLGAGLSFPGEPGGPPRGMTVVDQAGRKWKISRCYYQPGSYEAEREKSSAERRADARKEEIQKRLDVSVTTSEQFFEHALRDLRFISNMLKKVGRTDWLGGHSAYRLPAAVRARIRVLCNELGHLSEIVEDCELEADIDGQVQILQLQNALAAYSDPDLNAAVSRGRVVPLFKKAGAVRRG
jgi:hypothetical protein